MTYLRECAQLLLSYFKALNGQLRYTPVSCRDQSPKGDFQWVKSLGNRKLSCRDRRTLKKDYFWQGQGTQRGLRAQWIDCRWKEGMVAPSGGTGRGEHFGKLTWRCRRWVAFLLAFMFFSSPVSLHTVLERTGKAKRSGNGQHEVYY